MIALPFIAAVCSGPIISSNVGCILFARDFRIYFIVIVEKRDCVQDSYELSVSFFLQTGYNCLPHDSRHLS